MSVSPRRAREIARTRQDILEAAARAFVRSGFRAATMQDIAREAGYTAASLYGYFASKEEILRELHSLVLEELSATYAAPFPAGLSLRQKVEILMRRHAEVAERHFDLFALFHAGLGEAGCPAEAGESPFARRIELFTRFIEEHRGDDDLGDRTPREAALAITGISFAFFVEWLHSGSKKPIDAKLSVVMDLIFHGISKPAGSRAEG